MRIYNYPRPVTRRLPSALTAPIFGANHFADGSKMVLPPVDQPVQAHEKVADVLSREWQAIKATAKKWWSGGFA